MEEPIVAINPNPRTNAEWLHDLRSTDAARTQALEELRGYLVRAAVIYLERRWSQLTDTEHAELLQLAEDVAQEALIDLLNKLHAFRGESRFTTWAYKFVINIAAEELRRQRWRTLSLDALSPSEDVPPLADSLSNAKTPEPEKAVMRAQVWETLRRVIARDLTQRQRTVVLGLLVYDAPVEELVQRLDTTPNNVYKILHDARKKLKRRLLDEGITSEYVSEIFSEGT
ncbi:MAG: sigma-70 family RNA polymerase sigma factor [Chloroflexi bacterium]|nr:sigma-70 family RNA polymerase sigma factor [Chloroflexota bacterium]